MSSEIPNLAADSTCRLSRGWPVGSSTDHVLGWLGKGVFEILFDVGGVGKV